MGLGGDVRRSVARRCAGVWVAAWAGSVAQAATLDEVWLAAEEHNATVQLACQRTADVATLRWQALAAVLPSVQLGVSHVINQDEFTFDIADSLGGTSLDSIDQDALLPLVLHPDSPFTLAYLEEALVPTLGDLANELVPDVAPTIVQPKSAWSANLTVRQTLLSGQAFPAFASTKRQYAAALADERWVRQQVRAEVARAFYRLATARQAVRVAEQGRVLAEHQLELARRRAEVGLDDHRAVLRGRLGVAQAERDLVDAGAEVLEAEEGFARVTGLGRDTALEVPDLLEEPPGEPLDAQAAAGSRADVESARHMVAAAKLQRTAADLGWMPQIDASFTEAYNQVPSFTQVNWQWRLSFDLRWTLWDGGLRLAQSRQQLARVRSAEVQERDRRARAEEQIAVASSRVEQAERALLAVQEERELADEGLEYLQGQYAQGRATWLEVEQARLAVERAQMLHLQRTTARHLAALDLRLALGTL